jgi:hypothetical protein
MLVQSHDFSSVVEAKRSMKAGDVGRLMIVWKKWCVMAQSIKEITNYSSYLPCMIILLSGGLNPLLSKYLRHNLLISPTGCAGNFVEKDFWLEVQNYWLKCFYNKSGIGTQIDRLRDIFSPNIFLVSHIVLMMTKTKLIMMCHPASKYVSLAQMGMWLQDYLPVLSACYYDRANLTKVT